MKKTKKSAGNERGGWLSAWLILILLHSLFSAWLIYYLRRGPSANSSLWLALLAIVAIANVVAVIAIWNWKRWGLILYAIGTIVGIVIGLMLTGTQLIVFQQIIPLVILGYLIKDKWARFGMGTR
jgi:hypothetical protein